MKEIGILSRLFNFWQLLRESLWLVPAVISLFYGLLVFISYWLELHQLSHLNISMLAFGGETSDASDIISSLLSSMITMATLAISITVVSLSLAASQLGPRLIRTFMADRRTQLFIGMFFGSVTACFVLTALLHYATSDDFTPKLTISLVFLICFGNLFVLLMFVHHVAQSCIADNVVTRVSQEFMRSIARLAQDKGDAQDDNAKSQQKDWPKNFHAISAPLAQKGSGYIQFIDYTRLAELARQNDCRIEVPVKPGHFLVYGEPCMHVTPVTELNKETQHDLLATFELGHTQTQTQDIQFAIRHLVEIAIRALSPGINDSFTALAVIDHLCEGVARLFQRETSSEWLCDEKGILRVWARQCNAADIIFSALNQIRENSANNPTVLAHLMEELRILSELTNHPEQQEGVNEQWQNLGALLAKLDQSVPNQRRLFQEYETISRQSNRLDPE